MKSKLICSLLITGAALIALPALAAETFDFYKQGRVSGDLEPNAVNYSCTGGDRCSSDIDNSSILGGTLSFTKGLITVSATGRYYASGYSGSYTAATVVQDHDAGWNASVGAGLGVYHLRGDNSDDNITANEMLVLDFGQTVTLSNLGLRSDGHNFTGWISGAQFEYSTNGSTWQAQALPQNIGSIAPNLTSQTFYFRFGPATHADQYYIGSVTVTAVPEPETCAMMLAGLGLLGFVAHRRKRGKAA